MALSLMQWEMGKQKGWVWRERAGLGRRGLGLEGGGWFWREGAGLGGRGLGLEKGAGLGRRGLGLEGEGRLGGRS